MSKLSDATKALLDELDLTLTVDLKDIIVNCHEPYYTPAVDALEAWERLSKKLRELE